MFHELYLSTPLIDCFSYTPGTEIICEDKLSGKAVIETILITELFSLFLLQELTEQKYFSSFISLLSELYYVYFLMPENPNIELFLVVICNYQSLIMFSIVNV